MTVEQVRASAWGWGGAHLSIRVAQATEESRPQASVRIYVERAERLIADLREQNRRLPALQDELNKAGL